MTRTLPARFLRSPPARRAGKRRMAVGPAGSRVVIRLWAPLTPLFLLLAPLALLAAPLLDLAPAGRRLRPVRAACAIGALLLSLSGTCVDVDTPKATVRIRIF